MTALLRAAFQCTAIDKTYNAVPLKAQTAHFLHNRKDCADSRKEWSHS